MIANKRKTVFQFKQFDIHQDRCTMKVGTDGIMLGAWAPVDAARRVLDIGTGSGVIAIMLAQRAPEAAITAVEIEEASFTQARDNMAACTWCDRLVAVHQSIQDFSRQQTERFDLIVSNPPFFSGGTFSHNQDRNSVRHTVKLPNGDLLSAARNLLAPTGRFCVILPHLEGLRFVELARSYKLYCTRMTEVFPTAEKPVERLLLQFEPEAREVQDDRLIIQRSGERNDYSEAYVALTQDFYTIM
ncbi:MAG: methyltransferase [Bacteroidota bacterium]